MADATAARADLLSGLDSADWATKFNAIQEIGRQRLEGAVERLGVCLQDTDPDIRHAAVEALRAIATEPARALIADYRQREKQIALEENVSLVLDAKRKPGARLEALEYLTKENHAGLLALARQCAQDADLKIERAAVRLIAQEATADAQTLLRQKLDHKDVTLRGYAFLGLHRSGSRLTGEAAGFLAHPDWATRVAAIQALAGAEEGPSVLALVEQRLRKLLPSMGWDSVDTFDSHWDDLERCLNGQSGADGKVARPWHLTVELAGELVELFETYRKHSNDEETTRLFQSLRREFRPLSPHERRMARIEDARPRIAALLPRTASDPSLTTDDVLTLGSFYFDLFIVPFLLACAADRRAVDWVPGRRLPGTLQSKPDMEFERSWLGVGNALAFRFRNRAAEAAQIIDALCHSVTHHPDWSVRFRAAQVLRHLKDERALAALRSASQDPEPDVAAEAREALEEIAACGERFGRTYDLPVE